MDKDFFERASHWKLIGLLIIFSYGVLMAGNGLVSLTHPDEVFYVQSAKEMIARNHWWTPVIFDGPHFEKPIFFFWLLAGGIKVFGLTPFVARFWPAFFGIAGVCITYGTAWMLFQRRRTAFFAGMILGSSFIYLAMAKAVLTDMVFSVIVTGAMALFYRAYTQKSFQDWGVILCFIVSAVAVLTKGALGIIFPSAVAVIFLVCRRDLAFLKTRGTGFGILLFLIIALPWHVLMYQWYGRTFIDEYIYNVHIRRILIAEHPKLDHWYFYPGLMFGGILPWSFFWFPAAGRLWKTLRYKAEERGPIIFLLSWITGIFIFVQPAHSKLASYVFPVFPAIAVIIAYALDHLLREAEKSVAIRALRWIGAATVVFFLGTAAAAIAAGRIYEEIIVNRGPIYVFAGLLVSAAVLIFFFNKRRQYVRMVFVYPAAALAVLATLFLARPYIEPWVSCEDISTVLKTMDASDSTLLASKFYVRGVRFYTDRKTAVIDINGEGFFSPHPIPFLNTDEKVREFLKTQAVTYAVVKEGNVRDLERIVSGRPYRLENLAGTGGKYILRITQI